MAIIPGMLRVCAVSPRVHLANPKENAKEIAAALMEADRQGASLCVFPELCLTGATCGDLFFNDALLRGAKDALLSLLSLDVKTAFIAGLPLEMDGRLYDCAAVVCGGRAALVPKMIPGSRSRWFAPGASAPDFAVLDGQEVPVLRGEEAVIALGDTLLGVCIGEDLTAPFSAAASLCASGAMLIASPAANSEACRLSAMQDRRRLALSDQLECAVVYANAGMGESTTDEVYAGYTAVYEAGDLLAHGMRYEDSGYILADTDIDRLRYHRRRSGLYAAHPADAAPYALAPLAKLLYTGDLKRSLSIFPFIEACGVSGEGYDGVLAIQVQGLLSRMKHIGTRKLVIGVSGGLDSTHALLVAALAYRKAGWDTKDIYAITMPGFGTSKRTHSNAENLSDLLKCTALEIPIGPAVTQHFADIGQDPDKHDICYENSQARERTQILMDYANKVGGIVLGTGDLSELALGFCTYNGDQMSMYNVNGSIPKTLMRALSMHASEEFGDITRMIVGSIVDTPVSPELVPGEEEISQKTEDILGSYDLHDFFIWHMMDSGAGPKKLYALAAEAFGGRFDQAMILRALDTFVRRFFAQQFKRSAMPDGPAATGVSFSPRGGFVCPSDAQRALWMAEVEEMKAQ